MNDFTPSPQPDHTPHSASAKKSIKHVRKAQPTSFKVKVDLSLPHRSLKVKKEEEQD